MATHEFMSPSVEGAVRAHEMFETLLAGGFTEAQAIALIAHLIAITPQAQGESS